jgi:type I restriction enzyme S subunit
MKKYNTYIDSGVKWIGLVPKHWDFGLMKYQLSNNDGGVWGDDIEDEDEDEGTIVIRSTEITIDGNWNLSCPMKRRLSEKEIQKSILKVGDIVLTKSSGSPDHIGKSVIVDEVVESLGCCYSNFVQRLRFRNYEPKLYHYILNSYVIREQYRYVTQSTTGLGNLNGSTINEIFIPYIPISEQHQIVKYLDEKTTIIDTLIEKTQQKIDTLKELRSSLINQVVTKGLEPNVEMKDSGVEWIGEIPKHWELVKIKHITNQVVDGTHFTPEYTEFGIPFLRVTDIGTYPIDLENVKYISVKEHNELIKRCKPEKGDLLLSKNGTIGVTRIIDWDWEFSIFVSLCLLKFNGKYNPQLFSYFFQSVIVDQQISESSKKSTVTNLHLDKIRELILINPPHQEQYKIVEYLDQQTQLIDSSIQKEELRIEKLKEFRQSLISDVVTGKIKVTDYE